MNGSNLSKEFLYQALALIVSIILVHATYVSLIRPEAKAIIAEQQIQNSIGHDSLHRRT